MLPVAALLLVLLLPLVVAALLDVLIGDPVEGSRAERWYPPVLVGRLALRLDRHIPRDDPRRERWAGALLWTGVVGVATLLAVLLVLVTGPSASRTGLAVIVRSGEGGEVEAVLLGSVYLVVATIWLKSCFTISGLLSFCSRPLGLPLEEKRRAVAAVVNRPTDALSDALLNSALIESAAENTTDSVIAPLLAYALIGLPGAVAYRAINTLDALLGHRDRRRRYVGELTAKIDHIVNWAPDRITAGLLRLVGGRRASETRTGSLPDDDVPRSIVAISRVAGVRLERSDSYVVGPDLPPPSEDDVRRVLRTVKYAAAVGFVLSGLLIGGLVVAGWSYLF